MNKTIYRYTDDSWWDGDFPVECYNAKGWPQNGSASGKWELYKDVLASHRYDSGGDMEFWEWSDAVSAAYEGLTLEELESLCERMGIVLEEV